MNKHFSGIYGQVKSHLTEFLLDNDYRVQEKKRRSSSFNPDIIIHINQNSNIEKNNLRLHFGNSLTTLI